MRPIIAAIAALLAVPALAQPPTAGQYFPSGTTIPTSAQGVEQVGYDSVTGIRCMVGESATCQVPTSATLSGAISVTSGAKATAAAPTYVEGTTNPVSQDLSGDQRVLDSAVLAAVQASIPAGTANIGTVGQAQGSTTSGQSGQLVQGAVTTSSPTYTTGQTAPLSLDTTGALRITAPAASPVNVTVNSPPNDVLTGPTSLTGAGDVTVNSQGSGAAALQITGTFTGLSGVVRGSVDGATYVNIGAYNANTGVTIAAGTTISATGIYVVPAAGYRTIQYHVTAVSTGTAVVNLNSSAGALDPPNAVTGSGKNENLTGVNGSTPLTGNGVTGSGSLRVTVASDNTAFSTNTAPIGVTTTDKAGSISSGGVAQTAIASNASRKGWCVQNPSAATEDLFVRANGTASATTGLDLPPGQQVCSGPTQVDTSAISVFAATTAHTFLGQEVQ